MDHKQNLNNETFGLTHLWEDTLLNTFTHTITHREKTEKRKKQKQNYKRYVTMFCSQGQ